MALWARVASNAAVSVICECQGVVGSLTVLNNSAAAVRFGGRCFAMNMGLQPTSSAGRQLKEYTIEGRCISPVPGHKLAFDFATRPFRHSVMQPIAYLTSQ